MNIRKLITTIIITVLVFLAILLAFFFIFQLNSNDQSANDDIIDVAYSPTQALVDEPIMVATEAPITECPMNVENLMWINVSSLELRAEPNLSSEVIEEVPYGYCISGDISDDWEWVLVSWEGVMGYLYMGESSTGRANVVFSESDLEPLE